MPAARRLSVQIKSSTKAVGRHFWNSLAAQFVLFDQKVGQFYNFCDFFWRNWWIVGTFFEFRQFAQPGFIRHVKRAIFKPGNFTEELKLGDELLFVSCS